LVRETDFVVGAAFARPWVFLQVDEELLRQQQEAYKVEGVDDSEELTASQLKKKRKATKDEVSTMLIVLVVHFFLSCNPSKLTLLGTMCRGTAKNRRNSV
jgi:hypothetical protein